MPNVDAANDHTAIGVGGYDIGYNAAELFWSDSPASLVEATFRDQNLSGLKVLDLGCGEGKNAAYLAKRGAKVLAIDVSERALENGSRRWGSSNLSITFERADARSLLWPAESFDIVVSYGLLHCLGGVREREDLTEAAKAATKPAGIHVVCALNSRLDGFAEGHLGFRPVLATHRDYLSLYSNWTVLGASDEDLTESHPPNHVSHTHAVTRFTAKKP